jgi:hypothetical protein
MKVTLLTLPIILAALMANVRANLLFFSTTMCVCIVAEILCFVTAYLLQNLNFSFRTQEARL